jgi:hypothetical protein
MELDPVFHVAAVAKVGMVTSPLARSPVHPARFSPTASVVLAAFFATLALRRALEIENWRSHGKAPRLLHGVIDYFKGSARDSQIRRIAIVP